LSGVSVWELKATGGEATAKTLSGIGKELVGVSKVTANLKKGGGVSAALGDAKNMSAAKKLQSQLTAEITKQKQAYAELQKSIDASDNIKTWRQLKVEASDARDGITSLEKELETVQKRLRGIRVDSEDAFDNFGGGSAGMAFTSGARTIGQAVGGSSFDGAGAKIAASANSVAEFADNASQLKETLQSLAPVVTETVASFRPLGTGLKGVFDGLKAGTAGLAASLTVVGVAAVGITIALVAVSKIFEALQASTDRARVATEQYIEASRTAMELDLQINALIAAGDAESLRQQIAEQTAQRAGFQALIDDYNVIIGMIDQAYANSSNWTDRNELAESGRLIREDLAATEQQFRAVSATLNTLQFSYPNAQRAEIARAAAERVTDAESELTQTRLQARDSTIQFAKSLQEFTENVTYERGKLLAEREREDTRSTRDHLRDLARLNSDGAKAIAGINREYWKSLAGIAKEELKAQANALKEFGKSNIKIEFDYNRSVVRAYEQRNKNLAKEQRRADKEALRQKEDLNDTLFDAELDNNVISFLQAKRDADKQAKRDAEDKAESAAEEREAFQENLDDLRTQRDEARADLLTSFREEAADRREALTERLGEERESYMARLTEQRQSNSEARAEARAAYTSQRADLIEQRQWEDVQTAEANRRQLEQMTSAHEEQLAELGAREANLLRVIETGGEWQIAEITYQQLEMVEVYRRGGMLAAAAARDALAGSRGTLPRTGAGSGGMRGRRGDEIAFPGRPGVFADSGGVFNRPTFALLGERRPEAVIPLSPSGGLANDVMRLLGGVGQRMSFDFSGMSIGSGVSEETIKYNLQLLAHTIVKAISDSRQGVPFKY